MRIEIQGLDELGRWLEKLEQILVDFPAFFEELLDNFVMPEIEHFYDASSDVEPDVSEIRDIFQGFNYTLDDTESGEVLRMRPTDLSDRNQLLSGLPSEVQALWKERLESEVQARLDAWVQRKLNE